MYPCGCVPLVAVLLDDGRLAGEDGLLGAEGPHLDQHLVLAHSRLFILHDQVLLREGPVWNTQQQQDVG